MSRTVVTKAVDTVVEPVAEEGFRLAGEGVRLAEEGVKLAEKSVRRAGHAVKFAEGTLRKVLRTRNEGEKKKKD
jgi:hypothetical protein